MPASPPIVLSIMPENENMSAPHSDGKKPPMVEPMKANIQIRVFASIEVRLNDFYINCRPRAEEV